MLNQELEVASLDLAKGKPIGGVPNRTYRATHWARLNGA